MTGTDKNADHAAVLYGDSMAEKPDAPAAPKLADNPARTSTPQSKSTARGPAARSATHSSNADAHHARALYPDMAEGVKPAAPTGSAIPWIRLYGHSMAAAASSEPTPTPAQQQVQHAQRTGPESSFDAIYDGAHRDADLPQLSVQQVVTEQQSAADSMYPEGGQPLESAEAYSREALGEGFDGVLTQARHDQDAAEEAALAEGREQASALLAEWQVPGETARSIALELDGFNQRWIKGDLPSDEELESSRQKGEDSLRKEWGPRYDANVELARRTYKEASKRLPWLRNLVEETGAGNSSELIRHFATVGLKNARNRTGSGRNRR